MPKLSPKRKLAALEEVAKEIEKCEECKRQKVGMAVPGEGNADADIVFIGEAPGKNEAATGRPFIGRAGKLLRELIKDAGLKDEDVYITSPVKRLPEYVTPTPADIEHGRTHLSKQLAIIQPKVVVLMGNTAVQALLHQKMAIAKEHGKIIEKDGIRYLIAYHPAAPLYAPKVREEIVKDFKKLKSIIARS
jgi:uracil-DNA glycosylase